MPWTADGPHFTNLRREIPFCMLFLSSPAYLDFIMTLSWLYLEPWFLEPGWVGPMMDPSTELRTCPSWDWGRRTWKIFKRATIDSWESAKQVVSSANCEILHSVWPIWAPFWFSLFLTIIANSSTASTNSSGDTQQPCLTPFLGQKYFEVYPAL